MPTVTVRYFAVLRDLRKRELEQVSFEPGTTVSQLYQRIFPPGPEGALPVAYAVDLEYVSPDEPLRDGVEVAFIPPVGGG